uniref:Uncharacterized protein n=1 Tax=Strix occidentalis caurina TaxID=311401 RepID=A0A8D0F6Q9_STROC
MGTSLAREMSRTGKEFYSMGTSVAREMSRPWPVSSSMRMSVAREMSSPWPVSSSMWTSVAREMSRPHGEVPWSMATWLGRAVCAVPRGGGSCGGTVNITPRYCQ